MLNKQVNTILVFVFLFLLTVVNFAQNKRAMWIWNNSNQINNMVNDVDGYRDSLFAFCGSPHGEPANQITVLFFGCSDALIDNQDNLRNFLSEASDSGLTIEFLAGSPNWATYRQSTGYTKIQQVIDFNAGASSDKEKFAGIQFDVEPYLLKASRGYNPPYWNTETGQDSVWQLFNSFVDSCQKMVDQADTSLYFGVAIPRWYENYVGADELKEFQNRIDYVAIMDYQDSSSSIISGAVLEVRNATNLSKKVWIGVDTKESSESEKVTFYEEGVVYMEEQLAVVESHFADTLSYEGIAIHSYAYYKSMVYDPDSLTAVPDNPEMKTGFELEQNYPNPFNPSTTIKFAIPSKEATHLVVYDTMGREVATLVDGYKDSGEYEVDFDASNLSSGIYFYRLTSGSYIKVRKMLLLK